MNNVKKVMVLTGKRGGYGAMKPMLHAIEDSEALELQLVVTDQHVSDKFGSTIKEIEKDFHIAAQVDMEQAGDSPADRAAALGVCTTKMSAVFMDLQPDICVLYGDRGEVLATAIAATMMNIPIAHLQGGDVSGSLDEQMRHAITKLSHLHFPSNSDSAHRIEKLGEENWRIYTVGDSHIDSMLAGEFMPSNEVFEQLDLDTNKPVIVVLQHSETTAPEQSYEQMKETLLAVKSSGYQSVVIHPCSDQGYDGVIRAINKYAEPDAGFHVHVNLDAHVFWGLLHAASVLVGNSSAGLIETPVAKIPSINIGRRQIGRLQAENVINVEHNREDIAYAIKKAVTDEEFLSAVKECSQPYGDGTAGLQIVSVLEQVALDDDLIIKRMTY